MQENQFNEPSAPDSVTWPPAHWVPPMMVLLLTVFTVVAGILLGGLATLALAWITGYDLNVVMASIAEDNTLIFRNLLRASNLISHLFSFVGSSLAVAWWVFRKDWPRHLGFSSPVSWRSLGLSAVFMLLALPWVQITYWLNRQWPLPSWMSDMESRTGTIIQALLVMDSPLELIFSLIVIALIPALGEELLFRGIIQQQFSRWLNKPSAAIWLTACLFSLIHFQFAGFLPRMLLGAGLGYLFVWTRSLWAPIVGHFAINGVQVLALYLIGFDLEKADEQVNLMQLFLPGVLVLPLLWALSRIIRRPV
jgi:membrane protease YdiL (CAAX protease family)